MVGVGSPDLGCIASSRKTDYFGLVGRNRGQLNAVSEVTRINFSIGKTDAGIAHVE